MSSSLDHPPFTSSYRRPPPPSRPPLRVNPNARSSSASVRSAGYSPVKLELSYNIPTPLDSPTHQVRARPGGLAGISGPTSSSASSRVHSPPTTPGSKAYVRPGAGQWSRRGSRDSSLPPPMLGRGSDQTRPLGAQHESVPQSPPADSIHMRQEGSSRSARDGVASPDPQSIRLFAQHCRHFYFSPIPQQESANFISSTLASLPPCHRAAYTRLQSSLRASAHLHHLRIRISSFHALISSTVPSASLTPLSRQELQGNSAKSERVQRTGKFISTWCSSPSGGVEPFFKGLYAALRLQSRGDARRSGGGAHRVIWEIDDAVFLESGGPEFMHEAVSLLKGVLGFEDQPLTSPPKLRRIRTIPRSYMWQKPCREHTEDLSSPADLHRSRATSDPFIDHRPTRSRTIASLVPQNRQHSLQMAASDGAHDIGTSMNLDRTLSTSALDVSDDTARLLPERTTSELSETRPDLLDSLDLEDEAEVEEPSEHDLSTEEAELNKPRFRLWTFPSFIDDEEAENLLALFPKYIRTACNVRFPFVRPGHSIDSMEEGKWEGIVVDELLSSGIEHPRLIRIPRVDFEVEEGVVRCGTGRVWAGKAPRRLGWQGSRWFRIRRWWRRLFGLG